MLSTFNKIFIVFILIMTLSYCPISAQLVNNSSNSNVWSSNIGFGYLSFYGDILQSKTNQKDINKNELAWNISILRNMTPYFAIEGEFLKGKLEINSPSLDLSFSTLVSSYGLLANINLYNALIQKHPSKISLFFRTGINLLEFRSIKTKYSDNSFIDSYGYENNGSTKTSKVKDIIIPIGFGAKYKINKEIDIGISYTYRMLNSDKFDGHIVENTYNDRFGYISFSLNINFGEFDNFIEWKSENYVPSKQKDNESFIKTKQKPIKEKKKKQPKKKKENVITEEVINKDINNLDSINKVIIPEKKYHIVANILLDILEAEELKNQLIEKGFTSTTIITSTKKDKSGNPIKKHFIMVGTNILESKAKITEQELKEAGFNPRLIESKK